MSTNAQSKISPGYDDLIENSTEHSKSNMNSTHSVSEKKRRGLCPNSFTRLALL